MVENSCNKDNPPLVFEYTNWEGKTAIRKVIPIKIWFGHTGWHKEDQWLLNAIDIEKNSPRDFAMKDIKFM